MQIGNELIHICHCENLNIMHPFSSGSLWSVVLSYGVLSSVGQNLAILPTLTIPMAWFPERKGLVSGVVVSGFGAGAFAFNQVRI